MTQMTTSTDLPFERLMELMGQCQALDTEMDREASIREQINSEVQQLENRLVELKQQLYQRDTNIKALTHQWEALDDEITNTMALHLEQRRARKAKLRKFPIHEQSNNSPGIKFSSMGSPAMNPQAMGSYSGQTVSMGPPTQAWGTDNQPGHNGYQHVSAPTFQHTPAPLPTQQQQHGLVHSGGPHTEQRGQGSDENPFLHGSQPTARDNQPQFRVTSTQKEEGQDPEHPEKTSDNSVEMESREPTLKRAVNDGSNPFVQWQPVGKY